MATEFYKNVGKILKELRLENSYSQEYIASIFKISQAEYSRYESGERPIPLETISKLADLYKVSLDVITGKID